MADVKIIEEVPMILNCEDIPEDDRFVSQVILECLSCHWRFTGNAIRYGYGYTYQTTECPNYCPMCGIKIDDLAEGA